MPVPRTTDAHSVDVSRTHACSLDAVGSAWCWGDNFAFQLGVPEATSFHDPVAVSGGMAFTTLTLGASHTCGLTSVGAAYCWGDNTAGRLGGDQRGGPISTPELVAGDLTLVSLDARTETTCGATDAGHLYCWGVLNSPNVALAGTETCTNGEGKGGPITVRCSYEPLRMTLDAGLTADSLFVQVSGACALTSLGSVFCFDVARGVYAPVVGLGALASIDGEDGHTCGLTTGGAAWCWGWNDYGQLGDGTTTNHFGPVAVTGGHVFTQIAAGGRHTCGLTLDEDVWCWGDNYVGQAGTSILSDPWVPVKVHGQD
jgi:alpha-tubulin suppressor-like RCC1 family protein